MNDYQLLPVTAGLYYTVDFSAEVPAGESITDVTFTATGLTATGKQTDLPNSKASIRLSGAAHGKQYTLLAVATLSTGETVPKTVTFVGWND